MTLKKFIYEFEFQLNERMKEISMVNLHLYTNIESRRIFDTMKKLKRFSKKAYRLLRKNEIMLQTYLRNSTTFLSKIVYHYEITSHFRKGRDIHAI